MTGLRDAILALPTVPVYDGPDDDLCPNCVTPWKCNGPHQPRLREPSGHLIDRAAVLRLLPDPEHRKE